MQEYVEDVVDEPQGQELPPGGSYLDRLRKRREQMVQSSQTAHRDIEVPGYPDDLKIVVRFRPLTWEVLKQIGQRVEKLRTARKELLGHADVLIRACDEILVRDKGELKPIDPSGEPTRFEVKLAEMLGFEAKSARDVVFGLYMNDIAVTAAHNELAEWMPQSNADINEDLQGES